MKLFLNAITKVTLGFLLLGALLFLPAGTLFYPAAWLFLALLFVPMVIAGFILLAKSPRRLARRLEAKEKTGGQKVVVMLSGLLFIACFILCGLDFRYGWSALSDGVTIAAMILFLLSYGLYAEVIRENEFLARTIRVEEGQKVIDSGLYGIIRHPMYLTTVFLFLSMPLILGSMYGFLVMLLYLPVMIIRIFGEEKLLKKELPGYEEYCKKVRYRLLPFIF